LVLPASEAPPVAPSRPHARRIVRSFGYAFEGLALLLRTQPNCWVHVLAAGAALGLGIWLRLGPAEMALVVLTSALVLVIESINTALEALCDLVSPEHHPLVKRAKDVGAAAVLIAAVASVAIAALLFGPRLAALGA
jgi:diacylglycerol kinase